MPDKKIGRRLFLGGMAGAEVAAANAVADGKKAPPMKLAVGADHAGFPMKGPIVEALKASGHSVKDCGTFSAAPVDFPDIARKVCDEVLAGRAERGILVCGTGVGATIAANKIRNIRAALCHDTYCAHQCVEHDNVNVLCMGAWIIGPKIAQEVVETFLAARFTSTDPDFVRRVQKLENLEKR
jgi:ribose 5-phosphate isomerase B